MLTRYFLLWFPLMVIGILNGMFRDKTYGKWMGKRPANQIATLILLSAIAGFMVWLSMTWPFQSEREALLTGILWMTMTITFEFLFGRFVARSSWKELVDDYKFWKGRLWILVLVELAALPLLIYRLST